MPDFTTVSVKEAKLRTIPGRQGKFMSEYISYIQQLPTEQAGRLRIGESEKQTTVRRRLVVAAQALGIPLTIKRSGTDLYFWRAGREEEQPRKRRYTRRIRRGSPGGLLPPDMPFTAPESGEQGSTTGAVPGVGSARQRSGETC
jgi:hypothetical protein